VFRVAASVDGVNWYEANETIRFSIALPFWKTWWFVLLVAAAIIAAIYGIYRYQFHKQLEVERLRSRISRDLHDDIGSTLSSINILAKSSLTGFVKADDDKLLLQKIQSRSQKMLDAMDDLIWNTKPEHDSLESLTVRMREYGSEVMESAGITFTVHCPAILNNLKLDMEQKKNIYLIFKEAINNLAKYSRSKTAFVDFTQDKDCLEMVIRDEGIGFTPTTRKKGNGLENMRSRAAEMKAKLEITNANPGTTIKIQVPV
jgi:signal transduction histidine kinase